MPLVIKIRKIYQKVFEPSIIHLMLQKLPHHSIISNCLLLKIHNEISLIIKSLKKNSLEVLRRLLQHQKTHA